jgi:hypothetical protein
MNSQESFQGYLRLEVVNAEKQFEQAKEKVFALTGGPKVEPDPALLEATQYFSQNMQTYINALRRLAHFSAHQSRRAEQRQLTHA